MNHVLWQYAIAGGNWNEGVLNGSRTLNTNANAWNANGNVGVRGVSDAFWCNLGERADTFVRPSIHKDQP